jgi:rSAM/selenodomain-associated transferase 2
MPPPLSIIVPCLNEAAGIARTLEDLRPLRERGVEVIVVDGGSSDHTLPLAAPLADRAMVAIRGRAAQMNAGAAAARGGVLLFLHADCRLPANADQLIVDGIAKSAKRWGRFDVAFDSALPSMRVVACLMNWRSRLTGIATGDQGMFVTRELFLAHGGFADIPLMEDVALSKRLRKSGPPLCLTARITTSARRWEERGVLHTILLMWRLRFAYFAGVDPAKLAVRYDSVRTHD